MKSIGPQVSNLLVLKEAGSPPLRGTVNLILNLSKAGDGLVQVPDRAAPDRLDQSAEPVHRVRAAPMSADAVGRLHHMTSPLLHTFPSFGLHTLSPPPFFISLSTLCLISLPIKAFGGGARGFWKTLGVV